MITDFINEYLLIAKKKYYGITSKTPSMSWLEGTKYNVVCVQGFNETFNFLSTLSDKLNKDGYKIHVIKEVNTHDKIQDIANIFKNYIDKNSLENIVFVGHSKGGLIIKYLLVQNKYILDKTKMVFTIATPHKGSIFGWLGIASLYEMRPGNKRLRELYAKKDVNKRIVNIYPKLDNHVIPNSSLYLEGAMENIETKVIGHTMILEDESVLELIQKKIEHNYATKQ